MGSSSAVENDVEKDRLLDQMLLAQLLGELPERDRELIRMRYFQNKTQTEIAGDPGDQSGAGQPPGEKDIAGNAGDGRINRNFIKNS